MKKGDREIQLGEAFASEDLANLLSGLADAAIGIPVITLVGSTLKVAKGISDNFFAKKLLNLMLEVKDISFEDRKEFIEKLDDPKYGQKASETLLILLEKFDHLEKPKILANLIKAKVSGYIDLDGFLRLAHALERINFSDLISIYKYKDSFLYNGSETDTLLGAGVIFNSHVDLSDRRICTYSVTPLGEEMLDYGLNSYNIDIKNIGEYDENNV